MLAIDTDKRVVEDMPAVPTAEVAARITQLIAHHGANLRVLVDGAAIDVQAMMTRAASAAERTRPPVQILEESPEAPQGQLPGIDLAHAMLWDTYDRAARVQSWMLEQASAFTLDLLNNNKRLADQAGELQKRYQTPNCQHAVRHRAQGIY